MPYNAGDVLRGEPQNALVYLYSAKDMKRIASAKEAAEEVKSVLEYLSLPNPSRMLVADRLVDMANRLAGGGYVIGPRGLVKPQGAGITLEEGVGYYLGASTSPKFIVLTHVGDDKVKYKIHPFQGADIGIERWIAADLIASGSKTALQMYGAHMNPDMRSSLESVLKGGHGKKLHLADYKPVTMTVTNSPESAGVDLWRAAEEYGGVAGKEVDGAYHYIIDGYAKEAEALKNDRRFKVISVKPRKGANAD